MTSSLLETAFRSASGRVVAALAARYRDLDLAEEAFSEACLKAAARWLDGEPRDPAAWLYRVADRAAVDILRRRRVRSAAVLDLPAGEPTVEDDLADEARLIPDERLRLIFVCCHPAVAPDARAALTLRLVCGLSTAEIAKAFLVPEPTLAQRLVRSKRKIADAGVPFEVPGPSAWPDRLDAVLATLEIAYAKAHEDAAGAGPHAAYAAEVLELTRLLADLLPGEAEVLSLAALVRYAEARRCARVGPDGVMIPLADQNPRLWNAGLIADAEAYLSGAAALRPSGRYALEAAIQAAWCGRSSLAEPPPWRTVLALYDALLSLRDDPVVRLNRAVALAEVEGPDVVLAEIDALYPDGIPGFGPYFAVRADLLRRERRVAEASVAYAAALALSPGSAERRWLTRTIARLGDER